MNNLDSKVERINETVILIEDKLNNDLKAVLEGYTLNFELRERNQNEIDFLKNESFNHEVKISDLEITTREHSKKLKELIS